MNNNEKYCPFWKQACIKDQCELYGDLIKRCVIPSLSYNVYRLAEAMNPKGVQGKGKSTSGPNIPKLPEIPFNGIPA
jgi:hypothetical protein